MRISPRPCRQWSIETLRQPARPLPIIPLAGIQAGQVGGHGLCKKYVLGCDFFDSDVLVKEGHVHRHVIPVVSRFACRFPAHLLNRPHIESPDERFPAVGARCFDDNVRVYVDNLPGAGRRGALKVKGNRLGIRSEEFL